MKKLIDITLHQEKKSIINKLLSYRHHKNKLKTIIQYVFNTLDASMYKINSSFTESLITQQLKTWQDHLT